MPERIFPAPELNPEIAPFFAAAAAGRFLLKRCLDCGETHFYPRAHCPFCLSANTEWRDASGRGEIYSFTILRRAPIPFAAAYVALAEGPRILTNLVDCDFDTLAIGQAVRVVFKPTEGGPPIPVFTPSGAQSCP
jgi:uncharacterized OB-fold protein